jgi:ParB-like chromosome segregation protein Spo0J
MKFENIDINILLPDAKNPRKDLKPDDTEFKKITASIEKFGFLEPIVFNTRTKKIIGGHQRIKTLKNRGITYLHTIKLGAYSWAFTESDLKELTPSEENAANIALNKAQGDWDIDQLMINLQELKDEDFDIALTGFDDEEFAQLIQDTNISPADETQETRDQNEAQVKLIDKFVVPPFSVLDTRQGYWQERKRAWIALGIKSELGRGGVNNESRV